MTACPQGSTRATTAIAATKSLICASKRSPTEVKSWAVVGGGVLGMHLARELATAGHEVTLIESATELGGLAAPWAIGPITWDRHYHVIAPGDHRTIALVRALGLGGRTSLAERARRLRVGRNRVAGHDARGDPAAALSRAAREAAAGHDRRTGRHGSRCHLARRRTRDRLAASVERPGGDRSAFGNRCSRASSAATST